MGFRRGNKTACRAQAEPDSLADEALRDKAEWKPSTHEVMVMIVLSVISFMVSLDATIIVTSLTVSVSGLAVPESVF